MLNRRHNALGRTCPSNLPERGMFLFLNNDSLQYIGDHAIPETRFLYYQ